jgi:hypothetical protein
MLLSAAKNNFLPIGRVACALVFFLLPQMDKMHADAGAGSLCLLLAWVRISLTTLLHLFRQMRLSH